MNIGQTIATLYTCIWVFVEASYTTHHRKPGRMGIPLFLSPDPFPPPPSRPLLTWMTDCLSASLNNPEIGWLGEGGAGQIPWFGPPLLTMRFPDSQPQQRARCWSARGVRPETRSQFGRWFRGSGQHATGSKPPNLAHCRPRPRSTTLPASRKRQMRGSDLLGRRA